MATLAEARGDFGAADEWTYLDSAFTGIVPRQTADVVRTFVEDHNRKGPTKSAWGELFERTRAAFARLINAETDDVCFTGNTTEGVNAVASGLPWQPGDNVVICGDLEHPANIYPWFAARERGLELRSAPPKAGAIDAGAICAAADARTRVISVSSVTFTTGFRADLDALGRFCQARDIFLLVDATQSLGVLHTDVAAVPIDGLAVSSHKYLMGLYGFGALWCRRPWAERMRPVHLGMPGLKPEAAPSSAAGAHALRADARRFETRQHYLSAAALGRSCEYLLALGTRQIEAHAVGLATRLARGLEERGLSVNRDPFGGAPTHIVTVGTISRDGLYETSDPVLRAVYDHLTANRVRLSARRGVLRFSFHLYNGEQDVERVLVLTEEVLAGARRSGAA